MSDMNTQDGQYAYRPWNPRPRWTYAGPGATHEEMLIQQSLDANTQPGEMLSETVRPPLPQIRMFPARYGYDQTALTIDDIVNIDRIYREPRISWYSGTPAGYVGNSRNSMNSLGNV